MSVFYPFSPFQAWKKCVLQAIEAPEMGVAWDYSAFIVHMATAFLVTAVVSASVCRDCMARLAVRIHHECHHICLPMILKRFHHAATTAECSFEVEALFGIDLLVCVSRLGILRLR